MFLEARFFPLEGFPRVYPVSYLMGMFSILLYVDSECLFTLLSLLGYVEIIIIWLQVSLHYGPSRVYISYFWPFFLNEHGPSIFPIFTPPS